MITRSRVAAFLTAVLTGPISLGTIWLSKHMGLHLNSTDVAVDAGIAGAAVIAAGVKWLHGNSEFEKLERLYHQAEDVAPPMLPGELDTTELPDGQHA